MIDIFTREDMENISLCIFQYLILYYIINSNIYSNTYSNIFSNIYSNIYSILACNKKFHQSVTFRKLAGCLLWNNGENFGRKIENYFLSVGEDATQTPDGSNVSLWVSVGVGLPVILAALVACQCIYRR